jgi:secondary thiamine-phosphate synthase enzyme
MKTSKREEFIQITEKLNNILKKSEIQNGLMKIYLPHTTAAITINQNANPDVARDIIYILRNLIPHKRLLNVEGNSDAHFKSSLFGVNLEIPFDQNSLNLGDWQGVFLCEFDGPRTRNIRVQLWIPEI